MENPFILNAEILFAASKSRAYRESVRKILTSCARFFEDYGLSTHDLLPPGEVPNETFVVRKTDLSAEGYLVAQQGLQTWMSAVVTGKIPPSDVSILVKTLNKIRAANKVSPAKESPPTS